jgi:hypothetical protein
MTRDPPPPDAKSREAALSTAHNLGRAILIRCRYLPGSLVGRLLYVFPLYLDVEYYVLKLARATKTRELITHEMV